MNNGNTIKRVVEIALAILLAFVVWNIIGGVVMWLIRLAVSILVFGAVVTMLDWALFRRRRVTR